MFDDAVLADRFRYQLTMFEVCVLIGLSRRHDTYIAYKYKTSPLITGLMRKRSLIQNCSETLV